MNGSTTMNQINERFKTIDKTQPGWVVLACIILSVVCAFTLVTKGFIYPIIIITAVCSIFLVSRPFIALCILAALVGIEAVNTIQESNVYSITGMKLIGLILAFSLIPAITIGKLKLRIGMEFIVILFFFIPLTASFINAENYTPAISSTLTFLQLIVLWFAIRILVNTPKRVWALSKVVVISMTISAVMGIWQFYINPDSRITGVSQNAAVLSSDLFVGAWFAVALMLRSKKGSAPKMLWFIFLVILTSGILYSLSRAAYIAFIPSIIVASFYYKKMQKALLWMLLVLMLIVIAAPFVIDRLQETSIETDQSTVGHLYALEAGINMMFDYPLIGVGIGNFSEHYLNYTNDPRMEPRTSHNTYIGLGAEMGVFSLLAFLCLHAISYFNLWVQSNIKKLNHDRENLLLIASIAGALTALVVIGIFHSLQISKFLWILLAIASRFPKQKKPPVPVIEEEEDEIPEPAVK